MVSAPLCQGMGDVFQLTTTTCCSFCMFCYCFIRRFKTILQPTSSLDTDGMFARAGMLPHSQLNQDVKCAVATRRWHRGSLHLTSPGPSLHMTENPGFW